ncbi:MAG: molybdopterin molybdotransferase MoeA [Cyclobacteriaceae bacterium]
MITVAEAEKIILENTLDLGTETIPFDKSIGRVLAEPIYADRDFPPFDRVTMDGIAINYDSFTANSKSFKVEGVHTAGAPQTNLQNPAKCLEVMTGAILPEGCDTVIRYEDVTIADGVATINVEEIRKGQNIHRKGNDRKQGAQLAGPGRLIDSALMGVLTTVGKSEVVVSKIPRVAIISTGDELVDVDEAPLPHQIRKSNVYSLKAALLGLNIDSNLFHIDDDKAITEHAIVDILDQHDVLLLSGGVSKGKADFVPDALAKIGVKKLFHRVKQRPGKPFWFGTTNDKVVFAFPGNPVSTFLCFVRYCRPWLIKVLGLVQPKPHYAVLNVDFSFKPELTYFLQVQVTSDKESGRLLAIPVEGKGSGDLANLLESDGFLELGAEKTRFKRGEIFKLFEF